MGVAARVAAPVKCLLFQTVLWMAAIGAAPSGRADGAKVITELHAKEKGRDAKAGAELEKHL